MGDVLTFKFHYPRNQLLFTAPLTIPSERLAAAAQQWAIGNLVRIALVLTAWLGTLIALLRLMAASVGAGL